MFSRVLLLHDLALSVQERMLGQFGSGVDGFSRSDGFKQLSNKTNYREFFDSQLQTRSTITKSYRRQP